MRIAFISTIRGYAWGGADAVWTKAAESAAAQGHSVLIAATSLVLGHPRVSALVQSGAIFCERRRSDIARPALARIRDSITGKLQFAAPEISALKQFSPDLVIFSCGGTYDLMIEEPIVDWLRRERIAYRVIANWQREHPALDRQDRERARRPLEEAAAIFFLSERNLAATRRHLGAQLPSSSVVQIPLREDRDEVSWPECEYFGFAAVGRLEPVKGFDLLLHALHSAIGSESNWRITIFGRGPELAALQHTAAILNLADRTHFAGYVSSSASIWSDHHLFVSAAFDEGVPMTIPEAMFASRPVLATLVGGAAEWINEGQTGYLCAAPTLELMATSLQAAWNDRKAWRQLGANARQSALNKYDPMDYLRVIS